MRRERLLFTRHSLNHEPFIYSLFSIFPRPGIVPLCSAEQFPAFPIYLSTWLPVYPTTVCYSNLIRIHHTQPRIPPERNGPTPAIILCIPIL